MSVKVRPYRSGGWEVDIAFRLPNGQKHRERSKAPVSSRTGALRWGEKRERHLLLQGPEKPRKEVPTLEAFVPRFIDDYAIANRQKPSGIAAKRTILNLHLVGTMGAKKLDAITTDDVQKLKHRLREHAPKTVNNVLTVLSVLLKKAVEWDVIERVPCTIRLVKAPKPSMGFYDFGDYERLLAVAKGFGSDSLSGRAARRRSGSSVRRDDRLGVGRCGSGEAPDVHPALRVARARNGAEGRTIAIRADDRTPRNGYKATVI